MHLFASNNDENHCCKCHRKVHGQEKILYQGNTYCGPCAENEKDWDLLVLMDQLRENDDN